MNEGKNRYSYAYTVAPPEDWKVRIDVTLESRPTDAYEYRIYKLGWIKYWSIDWLFAIYSSAGHSITEIPLIKNQRNTSNDYVLSMLDGYKETGSNPLTEEELNRGLYLKELYKKTLNRMLSDEDYTLFKKIWHAITRDDISTVIKHLKGFNPSRILNNPS
jgi:hypothetical protein